MRGPIAPEHQRQYAPWVYQGHALVYEQSGAWQVVPAEVKEALRHYPQGITAAPKVTPRDRRRLWGNLWHIGIARYLIALVLLHCIGASASTHVGGQGSPFSAWQAEQFTPP